MFQTSEYCIKLHAVVVVELLLSEQCPLLQVCVHLDGSNTENTFHCYYTLYNCVTKKLIIIYIYIYIFFFLPIMVKCLNIWKNIGKPIYRSISSINL